MKILNDDGNEINLAESGKSSKWVSPTELRLPNGTTSTVDPNMLTSEIYNNNKFRLVFENIHPLGTGQAIIICEKFSFCILPHRYYTPHIEKLHSGINTRFDIIENFGDMIGKGNKLPSKLHK